MSVGAQLRYGLIRGVTRSSAFVAAQHSGMAEHNAPNTFLISLDDDGWLYTGFPNIATALIWLPGTAASELLVVCGDGVVRCFDDTGERVEGVDLSPEGPNSLQWLLGAALVEDVPYVCGMSRQVYRRMARGVWERFDHGLRTNDVAGSTAIAGASPDEIVAIGYRGEIWFWDGRVWAAETSPTNIKLRSLAMAPEGRYVAAGGKGVVLVGGPRRWEVVLHDLTAETFWSATCFDGRIILGSTSGIYSVDLGHVPSLEPCWPGTQGLAQVHAVDGVLYAAGPDRIARFDGSRWEEIAGPTA